MKKDIEWLKEEIGELPCVDTVFISDGLSYMDSAVPVLPVYDLINQLDEPEKPVELQELIEKYSKDSMSTYDVKVEREKFVNDLQNLLVPKQEITFEQAHDKLREESILSVKSFDYYWNCINDNVEIDEPGNLLVPDQREQLEIAYKDILERGEFWFDDKKYVVVEKPTVEEEQQKEEWTETVEEAVADFDRSLERLRELWRSMEVEELEE